MAKQVNKPFLITLTVVILVGIVGAFLIVKKPWKHVTSAEEFMARGEAAMAEKKYEEARDAFGSAWQLAPTKPEPLSRLGDALYQLARVDPENAMRAEAHWNQALQIDPVYTPAMESKMSAYIDEMEAVPRAEVFAKVREAASQLARLEPGNTRAASYQYIATLSSWYNNVQVDPGKVAEAVEGLKSLSKSDPNNANLPYHVARALVQYGQEATRAGKRDEALARYNEAADIVDRAAGEQPGNPLMLLRAGQIYDILDLLVPRELQRTNYDQKCGVYFDRARDLTKAEDPIFQEVQIAYATRKLKTGDKDEAERIYRDLLRRKPDDVAVRLVLAEILQAHPNTRKEAADLLASTVAEGEKPSAPKTAIARVLQFRAILRLASVRMDLLESSRDDSSRREMLSQIETDIAKAEARMSENAETLKTRGRLLLIKGDVVRALQVLSKADELIQKQGGRPDYDLMFSLARANLVANNNQEARRLLETIVKAVPVFTPARLLLVDLLLNSNEQVEAAKHIDELEKQSPNSALVARFRIFTLDPQKDKQQIQQYYVRLPEETRTDKLEKARIAIVTDKVPDAIRLLELVRVATPGDTRVVDRLARLYIHQNQREKAREVIAEALKGNPSDPTLKLLQARLNNATAEDLIELAGGLIGETRDPLQKALQMADLERLRGNAQGMWRQLIEAEKLAPNDARVQDALFTYYLATKQWDRAVKYIEPLTNSNFGGSYGLIYWWKYFAAKGDYAQAVQIGQQFTQKMPQFAVSWITLGQAHKMRGEYQEALTAFNSAREKQSANRDAMRGAIDCLYALGRHGEAKKIIDDAVKFYPMDLGLQEMLVEYELKFGDPRRVMDRLLGNIEREPNQLAHYLNASSMYYHLASKPGTGPEATADWMKKGLDVLKKAVERFPDTPAAYVALADMQALAKDRAAGEATLKAMVDHPKLKDHPEAKLIMAEYYLKGQEPAKAEKFLRDALAVSQTSMEIRRKLAVLLASTNRVDEALALLDQAGEQADHPMLVASRAEILAGAGRHADVEALANKALAAKPDDIGLLAILANAQFNQGKYAEAIATSDRVLAKEPKNSRALIARAMSRMRRPNADPADAITDLVAYRELNPSDHKVRVLLAEVYNRKQRFAEAMAEMQQALALVPNDAQLRSALLEAFRTAQPPRLSEGDQLVRDAQAIDSVASNPEWLVAESTWMLFRKQPQRAVDDARKAMTLAPNQDRYTQHYLGMLLNTQRERDLLNESDAMLAANPRRWWIYQARGIARKKLNDPSAETELTKAVNEALAAKDVDGVEAALRTVAEHIGAPKALAIIAPRAGEHPRYSLVTARLHLQNADQASALRIIEQAMAQRSQAQPTMRGAILAYAGAIYTTVKPTMPDKAIEAYQELVKLQPENVEALNQLAWLLAESVPPRAQEALQYSAKAYQLVSNSGRFSSAVFDTHGWVLVLCGKLDEGIELLQLVVDKYPTIEAHFHLFKAYQKQNKASEAAAQLDKAQQLIRSHDGDRIPVDPGLRQQIREEASKASATVP